MLGREEILWGESQNAKNNAEKEYDCKQVKVRLKTAGGDYQI
jgi:hypothetical protein